MQARGAPRVRTRSCGATAKDYVACSPSMLRRCATRAKDVLSGDFSVFVEAKAPALSEEQLYEVDESSDP
jgi:hypothetical protein